ncbi:MAG: class I SAM-dependent methyltransferase [Candidatus Acidiferrales bacterium]
MSDLLSSAADPTASSEGRAQMDILTKTVGILKCPKCSHNLDGPADTFQCSFCGNQYACEEGIPLLFWSHDWSGSRPDVTAAVKSFYEKTPFPNYDDLDSGTALREKAQKGIFARLLDEQIPFGAKVLEVGCGTGQLSNFLGMTWGRTVIGADACLNSLKLGQQFKGKNGIENVAFVQMNLFRPVFQPETFDLVVSNGVLHHTSDPFLGFKTIAKLVKPGGFALIGLYNKYSRLTTDFRRLIFQVSGDRFQFLDARLRDGRASSIRKQTWFMDQYKNPHESKHTIGEIQNWFDVSGFEFVNSVPKSTTESFSTGEKLFVQNQKGTKFDHFLVQLGGLLTGGRDGGFFIMIGRKIS